MKKLGMNSYRSAFCAERSMLHSLLCIFLLLLVLSLLHSCKKQEVGPQCPSCQEEVIPSTTDVLIGCEGNFGWGNATLSSYNPSSKNVVNQVFQNVNGFAMGDVLQDIKEINGLLYISMNNSGKIVMIDTLDYTYQGEIVGFNSPRYIAAISDKAYVSDLYADAIQIIDLASNTITGNIATQGWTEHLLIHENYLYAAAPDTNWVLKINTLNDAIEDTIIVGKSPNGFAVDQNNKIWMMASGGINEEIAKVIRYNPSSNNVEQSFSFQSLAESPSNLRIDKDGEQLFFLNGGLQTMSIYDGSVPTSKVILENGAIFYGMDIDPNSKEIYITDAVDYVQQGIVYRYDSIFQPLDTFAVGIIPQRIWFK